MGARTLAGALLAGYGLLVLAGALPHDGLWGGLAALGLGAVLLAQARAPLRARRAWVVLALGLGCAAGVLGYNAMRGSDLQGPELALLGYGLGLVAAAPRLRARVGRHEVGDLVGWSFPLVLAPLALVALNGVLAARDPVAAEPLLEALLAQPLAAVLRLLGEPAVVQQGNVILATPRGTLALDIGMVCAGLYPGVLFLGVLGLHGWREGLGPRRLALYVGLGILGLWAANLARLVVLARVGDAWGGAALATAHEHAGWILFLAFIGLFWGVVLRRLERAEKNHGAIAAMPPR